MIGAGGIVLKIYFRNKKTVLQNIQMDLGYNNLFTVEMTCIIFYE